MAATISMTFFKRNKKKALKQQESEEQSLQKKVRELDIKSKKLTNHLFTGEYHSAFKGRGMKFKEVREYEEGDDIRFIDWNVSARTNNTYSKLFEEEREISIFLMVDTSASNLFGTRGQTKKALIAEICATLSLSAVRNNDKVGLVFFSDKIEKFIASKKGREHGLFLLRELISFRPSSVKTDIKAALEYVNNISRNKHKSVLFILSDFVDDNYLDVLRIMSKRHEVIGIQVYDPYDSALPPVGLLEIEDIETGKTVLVDAANKKSQILYHKQFQKIMSDALLTFRKAGADLLQVSTEEDYIKILLNFFNKRKRKS